MLIKSRRLTWEGLVARMKKGRSALNIITGKPTERNRYEGLCVDGSTV